jgi:hypothetical protein
MDAVSKMRMIERERVKMMRSLSRVMKAYVDELPSFVKAGFNIVDNEVVISLDVNRSELENYNIEDYEVRRKRV